MVELFNIVAVESLCMVCILKMHNTAEEINGEAIITVKDKLKLTSTGEKDQLGFEQYAHASQKPKTQESTMQYEAL